MGHRATYLIGILLNLLTLLLVFCSPISFFDSSQGSFLKGGSIGYTHLSDYPPQPMAPEGIKSQDGRIIQCYAGSLDPSRPSSNIKFDMKGGIESFTYEGYIMLIFFNQHGILLPPPQVSRGTVIISDLKPIVVKGKPLDLSTENRTPEMEFTKDQAKILFISIMAGGFPESLADTYHWLLQSLVFNKAYLYITNESIEFQFIGTDSVLLSGKVKAID